MTRTTITTATRPLAAGRPTVGSRCTTRPAPPRHKRLNRAGCLPPAPAWWSNVCYNLLRNRQDASAGFVLAGEQDALAAARFAQGAITLPAAPALPRARQTVLGLARRLAEPSFIQPVLALAGATAALSAGVGFLPVRGAQAGLGLLATGAAASVLALAAALIQPRAGRAHDTGRLATPTGMAAGLVLAAAGLGAAVVLPGLPGLLLAGVAVGSGAGLVAPLGFAALSAATPASRLGQTMGAAEVGRELGDAGGPLLVGAIAGVAGLGLEIGLLGLAGTLPLTAMATSWRQPAT